MSGSQQGSPNRSFSSSEQVFAHFREKFGLDGDGDINAIALFAYALVEKDRVEWLEHIKQGSGTYPSTVDTEKWFQDKPTQYFEEKSDQAYRWFAGFARLLLRDEIEEQKSRAVAQSIGNLGKFWPGFWAGNLAGVTSNVLFTLLIVVFVLFINSDFSFIAWTKRVFNLH